MRPEYGETWVYESIVGAVPGIDLTERAAIAVQFVGFQAAVLLVAAVYDLWTAVPAGTAAVVVATAGSWLMLEYSASVRRLETPEAYRRLVFGSSLEVVLSVVAFVALVTYLFVVDPGASETPLLTGLFGPEPPALAVGLGLLIAWDVVYRIGTCWWASVTGLWRALTYEFDRETSQRYARIDALTVVFAAVQLLLVPFVLETPLILWLLCGHVLAVGVVSTLAVVVGRKSAGKERVRSH